MKLNFKSLIDFIGKLSGSDLSHIETEAELDNHIATAAAAIPAIPPATPPAPTAEVQEVQAIDLGPITAQLEILATNQNVFRSTLESIQTALTANVANTTELAATLSNLKITNSGNQGLESQGFIDPVSQKRGEFAQVPAEVLKPKLSQHN